MATRLLMSAAGPLVANSLFVHAGLYGYVWAMTTLAAAMPCCRRIVAISGLFAKAQRMAASGDSTLGIASIPKGGSPADAGVAATTASARQQRRPRVPCRPRRDRVPIKIMVNFTT